MTFLVLKMCYVLLYCFSLACLLQCAERKKNYCVYRWDRNKTQKPISFQSQR